MDKDRAKQLLAAIHSCQESGCEEECAAACEMLENDPELQRWFEDEMGGWSEFDEAIAEKFECCEASEMQKQLCKSRACAKRRGPLAHVAPLLAAAAMFVVGFVLLGGGGGALAPVEVASTGDGLGDIRADLAGFVGDRKMVLHHEASEVESLKSWLGNHSAPVGQLRSCVASKRGIGCSVLEWSGHRVSMICFDDSKCGGVVHLFIVSRSAFGEAEVERLVAQKSRHRGLDTGGWADADSVYLLVGDSPDVSVDPLLSS